MPEPWFTIFCAVYFWVSVPLLWRHPWLLCVVLAIGNAALLTRRPTQRKVVLWVVATAIGMGMEYWLSARLRIWVYALSNANQLPVWLFWNYGGLTLIFVQLAEWLHDGLMTTRSSGFRRVVLGLGLFLAVGYGIVVVRVVAQVFGTTFALMGLVTLATCHRGRDIVLFWVGTVLGLVGETSCIAAGVFSYAFPYFAQWGVPISMPLAWGLYTVLVCNLSELVARRTTSVRLHV